MVKRYTDAEIAALTAYYQEHGAVRLAGLIEPEWVERILATIDETSHLADQPQPPGRDLSFGRGDGRMTIRYMWRDVPVVREFLLRPELAEPIARIVGTKTLRFWFDLTFIHTGAGGEAGVGTPWHHDIAAFTFKGEQLPSMNISRLRFSSARVIAIHSDGSHRSVPGYYRTPDNPRPADGSDDGFLDLPDFDAMVAEGREKIITWDCDPGDAIIIHPYVIHGARGNASGDDHGRRVAITTRWLGDDVRYLPTNWTKASKAVGIAKSNLHLGSRAQGEYFPLVWNQA